MHLFPFLLLANFPDVPLSPRIQLLRSLYKHLTNDINWTAKIILIGISIIPYIFIRKSKIHKNNFLYKNALNKWEWGHGRAQWKREQSEQGNKSGSSLAPSEL